MNEAWKPILSRSLQARVQEAKKKTGIKQRTYIEDAIREKLDKDGI